jgi:hypothetical protein
MSRKIIEVETIQDALLYWRECLAEWGKKPDTQIAANMVGLVTNDHFEEWEGKEGQPQTDFSKVFELALELESDRVGGEYGSVRDQMWEEVRVLLRKLEEEYLSDELIDY